MPDSRQPFSRLALALVVEDEAWETMGAGDIETLARRAFVAAGTHLGLPDDIETEIAVTLGDDETVRGLNAEWRAKNKPTNILSFPTRQLSPGETPGPLAGDLILARETVAREAEEDGKPFDHHLSHLLVHGFLHLLGYDHVEDGDAETMETAEIAILAILGISDPYGESELLPETTIAKRA